MTCDFTSFSTVLQLYKDGDTEKLCAMELVNGRKDSSLKQGSNPAR